MTISSSMKSKNARIFRPLVQVGMGEDPEAADKARLRIDDAHDILFRIADLARQQAQPKARLHSKQEPQNAVAAAGYLAVRSHCTQPARRCDVFDRPFESDQLTAVEVVGRGRPAGTFNIAAAAVDRPGLVRQFASDQRVVARRSGAQRYLSLPIARSL